jgi:hypothetical protein
MRSLDTVDQWMEAHLDLGHTIAEDYLPVFDKESSIDVRRVLKCSCGSRWGESATVSDTEPKTTAKPNGWDNRSGSKQSNPYATPPTEIPPDDATLTAIIDDLRTWWYTTAENDFAEMEPKIGEYTASDLVLMGQFMEHWMALPQGSGAEAATLWYALGKIARAVAAYREGRLPSEDTLHDLSVYAFMARRIRQTGHWP